MMTIFLVHPNSAPINQGAFLYFAVWVYKYHLGLQLYKPQIGLQAAVFVVLWCMDAVYMDAVPMEARRGHQIPWNWVRDSCEYQVGSGNWTWSSERSLLSTKSSPQPNFQFLTWIKPERTQVLFMSIRELYAVLVAPRTSRIQSRP